MVIDVSRLTRQVAACVLGLTLTWAAPVIGAADGPPTIPQLSDLLSEAVANNPELAAARSERDAAHQRIAPAGALDDPMLEVGVVNVPVDSWSLNREDMTMKMLGLFQKVPFPGKRDLRRAVATADADSLDLAVQENTNRLVRDVRVAYEELAFNAEAQRILARTRTALEQLVAIARSRYDVGQATQSDVLDAQTELERLSVEQLRLTRENSVQQSELRRLLGRSGATAPIDVSATHLAAGPRIAIAPASLTIESRPQLLAGLGPARGRSTGGGHRCPAGRAVP